MKPSPSDSGSARRPISMHEDVAVWCDCCSCEAEPYWVEVAAELGIDLGHHHSHCAVEPPPAEKKPE